MDRKPDRLSANRICDLTGVNRQTRADWADRQLLRSAKDYGERDVMEQLVLNELLAKLKKSDVPAMWSEVQRHLRGSVVGADVVLVWDPGARRVQITAETTELRHAVCHGRAVHVLPLGELVAEARRLYRHEVEARKRAHATKAARSRKRPGQERGA
jgi:hypothetical protein